MVKGEMFIGWKALHRMVEHKYPFVHVAYNEQTNRMYICQCAPSFRIGNRFIHPRELKGKNSSKLWRGNFNGYKFKS